MQFLFYLVDGREENKPKFLRALGEAEEIDLAVFEVAVEEEV
jgi:hypothetical protein